ncbi:hypothetical protein CsSME_00027498 [Camellia sinensis var. sinensis]
MGGADMLIYPLRPISTPSHLLTRGSAIPSISVNLGEHHLISTACLLSWSSAAELFHPRPCCASYPSTLRAKSKEDRARRHLGKAEPGAPPVVGLPADQTITSADHAFPGAGHSA